MYRFRAINNLIDGFHELENQEIYFASPEELNDPMEGYRELYWQGDEIVWKNLLKNYIRSLEHIFALTIILNDEGEELTIKDIPIIGVLESKKSKEGIVITNEIISEFFTHELVNKLPKDLSKRTNKIRRNELLAYLTLIHQYAVTAISKVFLKRNLISKNLFENHVRDFSAIISKVKDLPQQINIIEKENKDFDTEAAFLHSKFLGEGIILKKTLTIQDRLSHNNYFLISEFPLNFLSRLEEYVYPEWYCASFLSDCSNSAVWGHYGENHTGVC